jgi:hypothetical protein
MGYLSLYTLSDKGNQFTDDDTNECVLLLQYLQVLDQLKEENRPRLSRYFMRIKQLHTVRGLGDGEEARLRVTPVRKVLLS